MRLSRVGAVERQTVPAQTAQTAGCCSRLLAGCCSTSTAVAAQGGGGGGGGGGGPVLLFLPLKFGSAPALISWLATSRNPPPEAAISSEHS